MLGHNDKIKKRQLAISFTMFSSMFVYSMGAQSASYSESIILEEILVVATKRETNLMETPIAISAFDQSELQRQGVKSARDLAGKIPNLQLGAGSDSGTATTIRGVTSVDFTEVGEGAVSYHIDGSYSPRPQGALALMYDLKQVEVARGPQGTLFGMNSPGGSINIIPAKPELDDTFGNVEGAVGSYNARQLRGMLNWALTDTVGIRATFMYDLHDGMMKQGMDTTDIASPFNGIVLDGIPDVDQRRNKKVDKKDYYNNSNQWGARVITSWQPMDELSVIATIEHFSDNGAGDINFVDCEQAEGTVNECTQQLRYANINVPGEKDLDIDDARLHIAYELTSAASLDYRFSFQNMTRSQLSDIDGGNHAATEWSSIGVPQTDPSLTTGYYPIWDETTETVSSDYETTTHEIQIKSINDNWFQYVAGVYYLKEEKQIRYDMEKLANKSEWEVKGVPVVDLVDGLPDTWVFDQNMRTTESKAAFAQFDFLVHEKVNLTAGVRYSEDEKADNGGTTYAFWGGSAAWYNGLHTPNSVRGHQSNNLKPNMGSKAPLGTAVPQSGDPNFVSASWKEDTYRLGAQYFIDEEQMLFSSVATGYKMGGMYEFTDTCDNGCLSLLEYDPEYVTTYELGYKGSLLNQRLRLSATAFLSNYDDMQSTGDKAVGVDTNPTSGDFGKPVVRWTTDNLTEAKIKGLELEFDAIISDDGRLSGYFAWLDTEITNGGTYVDGYACGEREIYGQVLCGQGGIDGNSLPFAPELSATINYEHTFALASGFTLLGYTSLHWQDDMWLDVLNYDGDHLSQKQAAYAKIDASLRIVAPQDAYYVELGGSNLTDEDTRNFGGFGQGKVTGDYDTPRLLFVRFGYDF